MNKLSATLCPGQVMWSPSNTVIATILHTQLEHKICINQLLPIDTMLQCYFILEVIFLLLFIARDMELKLALIHCWTVNKDKTKVSFYLNRT